MIQENALCMNVQAASASSTQETFTWDLDTHPHVTLGDATQEVFFGNDRVILEMPRDVPCAKVVSCVTRRHHYRGGRKG